MISKLFAIVVDNRDAKIIFGFAKQSFFYLSQHDNFVGKAVSGSYHHLSLPTHLHRSSTHLCKYFFFCITVYLRIHLFLRSSFLACSFHSEFFSNHKIVCAVVVFTFTARRVHFRTKKKYGCKCNKINL